MSQIEIFNALFGGNDPIQHFRLRTVTYRTASAYFLSMRLLKQTADDFKVHYPNAVRILINDFYVRRGSVENLLKNQNEVV